MAEPCLVPEPCYRPRKDRATALVENQDPLMRRQSFPALRCSRPPGRPVDCALPQATCTASPEGQGPRQRYAPSRALVQLLKEMKTYFFVECLPCSGCSG